MTIKINSRVNFPIKNFSKMNVFIKILDIEKNVTNFMCLKNRKLLFFMKYFLNKKFSSYHLDFFSDFIQRIMEEHGIISIETQLNSDTDRIFFINSLEKKQT
ncbi:hypothetical protein CPARA_2gp296 (nucleomorph) [Cryptomonas paramecium]|uniref:Uncharacterized protein n=1 Tax=Cryptomonas paramaecium TaxID=2898 RepID=F2HI08_9CRYP|nr:hypothetical protein CPARA_2gp296 [Cryptomonas paramecium]AEA38954.1 hypothetical protein CPARA_2gp296 [Cryptomonas paramecium]